MDGYPTISYEEHCEGGVPVFVRVCPNCSRFVKADESIKLFTMHPHIREPNASCKRCGRVEMPMEGFF
jgi:hypothetical protein